MLYKNTMDKSLIKLREKKLTNGNKSLYLDYYKDGVRTYEFLKLYLQAGNDPLIKARNKATYNTARTIQSQRILDIQQGRANILSPERRAIRFTEYYEELYKNRSKGTREAALAALFYWKQYAGENCTLQSINAKQLRGFATYLMSAKSMRSSKRDLGKMTAKRYFEKIKQCLDGAVRDELILFNPVYKLASYEKPQGKSAERQYLTLDEIKKLIATDCKNLIHKQAFLFSCFTGLRLSDIRNLEWHNIQNDTITIRMQKTGEIIYLPLSENAKTWLPQKSSVKVFPLLHSTTIGKDLDRWVKKAGIGKHITFHCARHTFATLTLTYGADLYTVSKLLGHQNIQVTQIYAKIVDEKKKEAVNLIPTI